MNSAVAYHVKYYENSRIGFVYHKLHDAEGPFAVIHPHDSDRGMWRFVVLAETSNEESHRFSQETDLVIAVKALLLTLGFIDTNITLERV